MRISDWSSDVCSSDLDHADQTHGIDDIRFLAYAARGQIPAYGDAFTLDRLQRKFGYCFQKSSDGYPPIIEPRLIDGPFRVGAMDVLPIQQQHGRIHSLGFRFGDFAYSNDVSRSEEHTSELQSLMRTSYA